MSRPQLPLPRLGYVGARPLTHGRCTWGSRHGQESVSDFGRVWEEGRSGSSLTWIRFFNKKY